MNPEMLLGGLLRGALGRGLGRDAKVALGMGAVGIAIAAFDHMMEQRQARGVVTPPPGPMPSGAGPGTPPPPPASPAPPVTVDATTETALLVRAMIAAAHADGALDAAERTAILERLDRAGVGNEERAFLATLMDAPVPVDAVVAEVASDRLAEQVYAVSLLAIKVDTPAESAYLAGLARRLALPADTVARLHAVFGVSVG